VFFDEVILKRNKHTGTSISVRFCGKFVFKIDKIDYLIKPLY